MDAIEIFEKAAEILSAELGYDEDEECYYVDIFLPDERPQFVRLYSEVLTVGFSEEETHVLYADAEVGPLPEDLDLVELLKESIMMDLFSSRVIILDDEDQTVVIQGMLPLEAASPEMFAKVIFEAAKFVEDVFEEESLAED